MASYLAGHGWGGLSNGASKMGAMFLSRKQQEHAESHQKRPFMLTLLTRCEHGTRIDGR